MRVKEIKSRIVNMVTKIVNLLKNLFLRIWDLKAQLFDILLIILVFLFSKVALPQIEDITKVSENNYIAIFNVILTVLNTYGTMVECIFISFLFYLYVIRKHNSKKTMNIGNYYHNHFYITYLFISKILNYKKCVLARTPVAMQFKLVINEVFPKYMFIDDSIKKIKNDKVKVNKSEKNGQTNKINLILSDTYKIKMNDIPSEVRGLPFVEIYRVNGEEGIRCYSENYIKKVTQEVHELCNDNKNIVINIFCTLNTANCYHIAKNVFANAGRTNIKSLFVYKQSSGENNWVFTKPVKIY